METLGGVSGSADFCRTLFDAMSDGCAHCRMIFEGARGVDWVYLAVNPAFETATGLKNVVGRKITELLPGIRESSPELFEIYGRVAAGGSREFIETYVKPLDAWFSIEVMPAGPGQFIAKLKNITSAKKANKAAAASETKFKALFDLSPDPTVVHRLADATLVMVNQAWCQLTGIPEADALGQSASALGLVLSLEEWTGFRSELHERGASAPRIVTIPTRRGAERQLLVTASKVTVDGEDLVLGIGKDVTDRLRMEAELQESEAAFRTIFVMSPLATFLQREGRFVDLNPAATSLFGAQEASQLVGQSVFDRTPVAEQAGLSDRMKQVLDGLQFPQPVETRLLTLGGAEVAVEVLGKLVTYRGLPTILVIAHDIRERKQSEKALADAMSLLERTGEVAKVGGCLLDVGKGQQYWTSQIFRILELEPGETPSLEQGLAYYSPEARPLIQAAIRGAIESKEPCDLEVAAITAKGRPIQVRVQCFPVIQDGRTVEVIGAVQDITEKSKAEESLRLSERKFSLAFQASPDFISINRFSDSTYLEVNDAFVRITGYSREEVIGRSPLPSDLVLWVNPEERQRFRETLLGTGSVTNFETRLRAKDGSLWDASASAALIEVDGEPCILGIIRDISARKCAEKALRSQEAFIHAILDHLPVGVAVVSGNPASQTIYMNDLFPRIYRSTRESLQVMATDPDAFWALVYQDPDSREAIKAKVLADIASGDPERMHWERIPVTRAGEGTTYIDARNIPLPGSAMMISTVWDVTEQVQREEENRRLEAQLHQVQKMESLGLLAGGVAHDINNVLGAILAVATLQRRKAGDGTPLHEGMETITQACLRGGALVKSLLGFARKEPPEVRPLNLNDLIREELVRLERTIARNITIRADLSDNLRELKGDPAALGHAILNLCVNAIEAMPNGGTLTVQTGNSGRNAVVLEVHDTGTGMAPEVMHQALVPFYSTKPAGTAGIGLGLAIVHGTVRSHRGTLDVQSEPGQGTRVRLRFPTSESPLKGDSGSNVAFGAGASSGQSVLFVDDDPLLLRAFSGMIEALGYKTTAVSSGEEALALIEQGFRPDLVILDVNMPGIGGLETLVQLRRQVPTLPVLLSTGLPSQYLRDLVQQHPGVYLMAKPFTMGDLERQIHLAIS